MHHTENVTEDKIGKRANELVDLLKIKDRNNKEDFERKEKVLRNNYSEALMKLIQKVKAQRDMITEAYGPLVLFNKRKEQPIFTIHNDESSDQFERMLHKREKVPQPIKIKVVTARCMKDKIGSGHFILLCSVMDRLGGKKISNNLEECEGDLRFLSQTFREYSLRKAKFMNRNNREMERVGKDGTKVMVTATKTGMGFFPNDADQSKTMDITKDVSFATTDDLPVSEEIDPETDVKLDFDRGQTKYVRFDGRAVDNDLQFDDYINLLVPPSIEPSNILLFELVLL